MKIFCVFAGANTMVPRRSDACAGLARMRALQMRGLTKYNGLIDLYLQRLSCEPHLLLHDGIRPSERAACCSAEK
jgi:hypothetical protein